MVSKLDRVGEVRYNTNGERMVIIRYGSTRDIDIQFDDSTIVEHRIYVDFKKGQIKNPMTPSVYGVGYIGIGEFKSRDENGKKTKCYDTWHDMLRRCYDPKFHEKQPTYIECSVCMEWHNFQNFALWFDENYYEIEGQRMALDKDVLSKDNKVYNPNNCIFVPQFINNLFTKNNKIRGECPIGVNKCRDKFQAWVNKGTGRQIYLGAYDIPEEAFQAYKKAKEQFVKETAERYKLLIPHELYQAMIAYEVEIDD